MGALATAAAHELGTPLGTIAVVARELERGLPENSAEVEDVRLLRDQAERCRAIIARLANPEEALLGATARLPLGALLDDIASPHRGEDLEIRVTVTPPSADEPEPQVWRAPELLHGLGNIIENAADFAQSLVAVDASWDEQFLHVSVTDDGPGFAPEIFERIGEPYVTSRPGHHALGETEWARRARSTSMRAWGWASSSPRSCWNRPAEWLRLINPDSGGARVSIGWPRGVIDGPQPPAQIEAYGPKHESHAAWSTRSI